MVGQLVAGGYFDELLVRNSRVPDVGTVCSLRAWSQKYLAAGLEIVMFMMKIEI